MPNFHQVPLSLSKDQKALLQDQYAQLQQQLERGLPMQPTLFGDLQSSMQAILQEQAHFPNIDSFVSSQHNTVHLMHSDNFILNLPWRLAIDLSLIHI